MLKLYGFESWLTIYIFHIPNEKLTSVETACGKWSEEQPVLRCYSSYFKDPYSIKPNVSSMQHGEWLAFTQELHAQKANYLSAIRAKLLIFGVDAACFARLMF